MLCVCWLKMMLCVCCVGALEVSQRSPLACWFSSMLYCFAGAILSALMMADAPIAPLSNTTNLLLATLMWWDTQHLNVCLCVCHGDVEWFSTLNFILIWCKTQWSDTHIIHIYYINKIISMFLFTVFSAILHFHCCNAALHTL